MKNAITNICTRCLIWTALLLFTTGLYAAEAIQDEWDNIDRVVIVGDLHGDYDNYIDVLRDAGLINRRGNWDAGNTHFVQLGDVPDRGPDTDRIIEHLQKLGRQAERRGGMVHMLIGNHEYMNVIGDLRYTTPGEYKAFTNNNSSRMREAYWQQTVNAIEARNAALAEGEEPTVIDDAYKEQWYEQFPLGYVEHRLAWQPGGDINDWVSTHNAVIRINDMLFMHGGLGPGMMDMTIREMNDTIRAEILGGYDPENSLGETENGPLWYRGLARNPEATEAPHVRELLDTYKVSSIILGHTPDLGVVTPRFGGQVIIADTGISSYYGSHKASVLVENGKKFALEDGEYVPLPAGEQGVIPYFRKMVELEPDNLRLATYLDMLINPPVEESVEEILPAIAD